MKAATKYFSFHEFITITTNKLSHKLSYELERYNVTLDAIVGSSETHKT